jgi:CRP-like cAMP-binding protein
MPVTIHQNLIPFLMNQALLEGVSESALRELVPYFEVLTYEPGSLIFREGDLSNDLYLVFDGEVSLVKEMEGQQERYTIAKLAQGEVFGEMSFIDDSPRSCSVETHHPLILIKLPRKESKELAPHLQEIYEKIVRNIASIVIRRMRTTNVKFSKGKDVEIRKLQIQNDLTNLLLNSMMGVVCASGISGAIYLSGFGIQYFYFINLLTACIVFGIIWSLAFKHNYPWQNFGLRLEGGLALIKQMVTLAALSALIAGVGLYIYSLLRATGPAANHLSVPFLLIYPLYVLLTELILRGTIQSLLLKLPFCRSQWFAVLYPALLVASCNGYFGFQSAGLILVLNVICGAVFVYSNHIFMPTIAHLILGLALRCGGALPFAFMT